MSKPKKHNQEQFVFAAVGSSCFCGRCGRPYKVNPVPGSQATMLKCADRPKGLCINCAVHNELRHLYPANLILARSGPKALVVPDMQQEFFEICRHAGTDARFEEIDWQAIIANWELPFSTRLKRTATNPVTEEELVMERMEGEQRRAGTWKEPETEEEYQARRQAAEDEFIKCMRGHRHEVPPTNNSHGQ
jgi:hypothetical protein